MNEITTIQVRGTPPYRVLVGSGVTDALAPLATGASRVVVLYAAPLHDYAMRVSEALRYSGAAPHPIEVPDAENAKTIDVAAQCWDALAAAGFTRSDAVVGVGGGAVTDLAGFVAASWLRGVRWVAVPTSLLGMVDAAVGGKTGLNIAAGKNLVGAFHPPAGVLADLDTLDTLPQAELVAGLAEVVKYGLIRDPAFFDWLEGSVDALRRRDPEALAHAVAESCRNKAEVVAADEREAGERALLNLGHTFGHAIETETDYSTWLHGEAVAVGMVMAARMSVRLGWLSRDGLERTTALLEAFGLPTQPPAIPEERFRELMSVDKKNRAGRLRLVLLRGVGDAVVTSEFASEALTATLAEAVRAG